VSHTFTALDWTVLLTSDRASLSRVTAERMETSTSGVTIICSSRT
jgi:hypothetical protein